MNGKGKERKGREGRGKGSKGIGIDALESGWGREGRVARVCFYWGS